MLDDITLFSRSVVLRPVSFARTVQESRENSMQVLKLGTRYSTVHCTAISARFKVRLPPPGLSDMHGVWQIRKVGFAKAQKIGIRCSKIAEKDAIWFCFRCFINKHGEWSCNEVKSTLYSRGFHGRILKFFGMQVSRLRKLGMRVSVTLCEDPK